MKVSYLILKTLSKIDSVLTSENNPLQTRTDFLGLYHLPISQKIKLFENLKMSLWRCYPRAQSIIFSDFHNKLGCKLSCKAK